MSQTPGNGHYHVLKESILQKKIILAVEATNILLNLRDGEFQSLMESLEGI